jgi:histone acetyltransferase 1
MILYKNLNKKNELAVRRYRLYVKRRLFIRNKVLKVYFDCKEVLEEMELAERFVKLEETYQSVVEDYRRILDTLVI